MRMIVNILIALMVFGSIALAFFIQQTKWLESDHREQLKYAIQTIQSQSMLRPVSDKVEAFDNGHAKTIDQAWFDPVPINPLVPPNTPWLEVATEKDMKSKHPMHITVGYNRASFWYNPHLGIVRARVPQQISQQATIDMYNTINETIYVLHPKANKTEISESQPTQKTAQVATKK